MQWNFAYGTDTMQNTIEIAFMDFGIQENVLFQNIKSGHISEMPPWLKPWGIPTLIHTDMIPA